MGPLSDISVCDLTQNLAGPYCSQILGDLGAGVIKVEPPGGDPARAWGPPFWGSDGTLFLSANRNKRSIVLDLKTEEGRGVLHELAARSDVLVESSRLGVAERLGFDYETIRSLREDVIYVSLSAFGDRGPLKELPGYEPMIQAFAGIMSVTGHADGAPARVGGSVVDLGTGMWSAIAVLAALRTRDATGQGSRIDTALLDTAVGWMAYHLMGFFATGRVPGRLGSALAAIAPYQAFETADGHVMVTGGNDAIFARLCEALGLPDLPQDPRFCTNPKRVANREELLVILEPRIREETSEELVALMRRHSVPCAPIQNVAQVAGDPQVAATEIVHDAPSARIPDYRDVSLPLRLNGERLRGDGGVPRIGQHSREILAELGYAPAQIDDLLEVGAVHAHEGGTQADG